MYPHIMPPSFASSYHRYHSTKTYHPHYHNRIIISSLPCIQSLSSASSHHPHPFPTLITRIIISSLPFIQNLLSAPSYHSSKTYHVILIITQPTSSYHRYHSSKTHHPQHHNILITSQNLSPASSYHPNLIKHSITHDILKRSHITILSFLMTFFIQTIRTTTPFHHHD